MKKIISLTLAFAMVLTLFAACGNTTGETQATTQAPAVTTAPTEAAILPTSALEILETTWNAFTEDEQFPIYGGDIETHNAMMEQDETYVMPNAPGNYDMAYSENLPYILQISEDLLANVDEAATMVHMMLANNFTCGALHLTEGTDVDAFTATVHESLMNHRWMCGFPEKELVAVVGGEYVVMAFGLADAMASFQNHLVEAYPDTQIAYNENF